MDRTTYGLDLAKNVMQLHWVDAVRVKSVPGTPNKVLHAWLQRQLEDILNRLPPDSGLSRFLLSQASRSGRVPHHRLRVASFDAMALTPLLGRLAAESRDFK